jgi:hypothetical protein
LAALPEPRDPDQLYYPKQVLVWSAILIFLLCLKSRRQFRYESKTPSFLANLNGLAGSAVETVECDDTIVYYFKQVRSEHFESLPLGAARRLIRMKALDKWRVYGCFPVAVDGTGHLYFRERHCEHCLTREGRDGRILYFHNVLEAKVVTASGLVFSLATEFIENSDPNASKQDCELKAFPRLAEKLKANFPRLPIPLLVDSEFACKPVFDICKKNRWHFIATFKRGRTPGLFAEFETLRNLAPRNRTTRRAGGITQHFAWVNDLDYQGHKLSAFECREPRPDKDAYFAWISDIHVGCRSVVTLSNHGGRMRWKIENEGFFVQKRCGYELEHAYCSHPWVVKSFYFLIQLAHLINQLMMHGNLLRDFRKAVGSFRNFVKRMAESLRRALVPGEDWDPRAAGAIQIRLDGL